MTKQTAETLTAGEKIIEALELADAERAALAEYEDAKSKLPPSEAAKLPPPQPNAMLAALGMEPEEYVLDTIEKISNTALLDALLVLPFGHVLSMMVYLDEWVRAVSLDDTSAKSESFTRFPGEERCSHLSHTCLLVEDPPQADCGTSIT